MPEIMDGVVVFTPERDAEARELARRGARDLDLPRVALWRASSSSGSRPPVPALFGADAYASQESALPAAIAWVKAEDRSGRARGPWRVVYLGSLGEEPVVRDTPVGKTVVLGAEPILIGRLESCAICLRQGPHSDQNTVARANTKVELVNGRPIITDLQSTNGTRVHDRELAVGLGQHLRLDGGDT
ncbi:MAG: FHA domain-containing protein [Labilithrix sp.]